MTLTKIDRMEHIEDIIQRKIANTKAEIASLGRMPDPEINRMRVMYALNLDSLEDNLRRIRQRIDIEYSSRYGIARSERDGEDEQAGGTGEGRDVDGRHAEGMQPERHGICTGYRRGGGLEHVGPDAEHLPGNDPGHGNSAGETEETIDYLSMMEDHPRRRRARRWQIEGTIYEV